MISIERLRQIIEAADRPRTLLEQEETWKVVETYPSDYPRTVQLSLPIPPNFGGIKG